MPKGGKNKKASKAKAERKEYGPVSRKKERKQERRYKGDATFKSFREQLRRKGFTLQVRGRPCAAVAL